MGTRRILALAAAVALVFGACGGDDGETTADDTPGDATDAPADDTTPDGDEGDGGGTDGTCAGTDLAFTNLTTGATVEVTDTAAVALEGGAAYTAYLADFEIDPAEVTAFTSPEVPADGNMVTFFITVFDAEEVPEPIEAGTEIAYSSEFGELTFAVIHVAGDEQFGNSTNAGGSVTVTAVGDTLCVEVDYTDDEKTLSGTIEATVTEV